MTENKQQRPILIASFFGVFRRNARLLRATDAPLQFALGENQRKEHSRDRLCHGTNQCSPITNHDAPLNSPVQPAPPADPASNTAPARRASKRRACRKCERDNCARPVASCRTDGAESGDQLLFFDGVFGTVGVVRDVGRDAEVFDSGSGDFWGVVG